MKSLTIILNSTCAKFLCSILLRTPSQVFTLLKKQISDRSLVEIIEGSYKSNYIEAYESMSDVDQIYMVVEIRFKNAFQSANSELIWKCLKKFAIEARSKFKIKKYKNLQVVQFKNAILMQ